jgi:hypothetical protein
MTKVRTRFLSRPLAKAFAEVRSSTLGSAGLAIISIFALLAVFAPNAPHDPYITTWRPPTSLSPGSTPSAPTTWGATCSAG